LDYGGPARSVPELACAQAALGHDVYVWAKTGEREACRSQYESVIRLTGPVAEAIDSVVPPDIVHDHGLWQLCHHQVARYCHERGIVRIVSPRGMLDSWSLKQKKMKKKLAWWAYQKHDLATANALHATAASEEEQLRALGFSQRIFNVPNGVSLGPRHSAINYDAISVPEKEQRVALFLSRVHPKKGLPMLMEAWAAVRPPNWKMQVVGPGDPGYTKSLRQLARRLEISSDWSFFDAVHDNRKGDIFQAASLFILPTYSENFGIVVAEALSAAVPVITTKGAPWSGLLEHDCGWWVAPEVSELATALAEATATPDENLMEMGKRGKAWVEQEFSWPGIADKMLQSYSELMAG
jgi:glycosyltransferase involved in cell wall biosynthesis